MIKNIELYPYGFLFSEDIAINIPNRFSVTKIVDKYNYYFDNIHNPGIYESHSSFIIIHGHFVHIGLDYSINNTDLPSFLLDKYINDYKEFLNTLDFIAGRFVIIIGNNLGNVRIYPDASNTRSSYYTTDKMIISSHVNLITDNFNYKKNEENELVPKFNLLFENSPFVNIKSTIPNYYVNVKQNSYTRFFPRENNKYTSLDKIEKFSMIEHLWKSQLKHYDKSFENLILSLTGGNDSRFSLAMARELNKDIQFFTYSTTEGETKDSATFSKVLSVDQFIVKQILEDIPLKHKFFYFDQATEKLTTHDLINLNKNTIIQHGRYILPFYLHAFQEKKVMHIRGNLLEIARSYYHPKDRPNNVSSVKSTLKFGFKKYNSIIEESTIDSSIDSALRKLKYGENLFDYHILDLFYWEDRMGRWYSEVLNETDAAFDTLLPFNMRAIIEISLSFSKFEQRSDYMFKELINRNHSVLNFYGRNEKLNLYEQQIKKNELNKEEQKLTLFNYFRTFDSAKEIYSKIETNEDTIFLSENHIAKNNFSEISFIFELENGICKFELYSKFMSSRGTNYLQYEVYKNDNLLAYEDIAHWNITNHINIFNMKKNDIIKIRVFALKNAKAKSWENASRISIKNYIEKENNLLCINEITCSSPFTKIIDK